MWRPDNWERIKPKKQSKGIVGISEPNFDYGVEAGADAMLEALKVKGVQGEIHSTFWGNSIWWVGLNNVSEFLDGHLKENGWLIFIPDE